MEFRMFSLRWACFVPPAFRYERFFFNKAINTIQELNLYIKLRSIYERAEEWSEKL